MADPGLIRPCLGTVTQGFQIPPPAVAGWEPPGYVQIRDGASWQYRTSKFDSAVFHRHFHPAQDVANTLGTAIRAVARVRLLLAGTYDETGEHYIIAGLHKNAAGAWDTVIFYTHLLAGSVNIHVGATVNTGGQMAKMGASGHVSGPHLHWEVRHSLSAVPGPVRLSGSWPKFNPARVLRNGDMARAQWLISNF